jgi:hypothetical protein
MRGAAAYSCIEKREKAMILVWAEVNMSTGKLRG